MKINQEFAPKGSWNCLRAQGLKIFLESFPRCNDLLGYKSVNSNEELWRGIIGVFIPVFWCIYRGNSDSAQLIYFKFQQGDFLSERPNFPVESRDTDSILKAEEYNKNKPEEKQGWCGEGGAYKAGDTVKNIVPQHEAKQHNTGKNPYPGIFFP